MNKTSQQEFRKEAWQYTREQFRDAFENRLPFIPVIYTTGGTMVTPETTGWGWHVDSRHKKLVSDAIKAGEDVPKNVISSHPEIAKQMEREAIKEKQKKAMDDYIATTRRE